MPSFLSRFNHFDTPLFLTVCLLVVIGLSLQYSIAISSQSMGLFYRHLLFVILGFAAYLALSFFNYQQLAKLNRIAYPLLVIVLLVVLFFSRTVRGSTRWIDFGLFGFQPAELAKFVVILGLSRWLYLKRGQINSWKSIGQTLLYALIPAGLVLLEPDLGSALIIMGVWLGMVLISPIKKRFVILLVVLLLAAAGLGWKFVLKDYQKTRIEVFVNPSLDPRGRGYNVRQAIIAVGSGKLLGRGLGQGLQSQLRFLPERQTDFIFASASEEIGFLGCTALMVIYSYLFFRLLRVIARAKDDLGMYIASGVLFMLFGQTLINVGMNMGLFPVTGIPLPFLSYGGNSMIIMMASLGVVQNVYRQARILRF